jgi:prepilin signal peptidase PulO-like enzyme (type II secretory pathway)
MVIVIIGLLGLIFGSFVNAFVWRLHETEALAGKTSQAAQKRRRLVSISKGRSICPNCEHELGVKDLVPVLSWVSLGGKCRYCHKPISWQYPLVELATAVLFVVSYFNWPVALNGVGLFQFVCWLIFVVAFMALAIYDFRWFILPDRVVLPLMLLAVLQVAVSAIWLHSFKALWEPAVGALIIFGLFWLLFQVSKGTWIGGGDVKLAIVLGLLAGTPLHAFLVIFAASLIGTVVSIPLLAQGKRGLKLQIPFGPYLLAGTIVVVLQGSSMVNWYQNLLLR